MYGVCGAGKCGIRHALTRVRDLQNAVSANLLYGFGHVNLQNLGNCQTAAVYKPLLLPRVLEAKKRLRSLQEVVVNE
jgi:hypothetical protein